MTTEVYFFGCLRSGHYLHDHRGKTFYDPPATCPWTMALMDTGLLKNGKHRDIVDGQVFWTCGGPDTGAGLWHAFFWWDRSGDSRPNSNSGFYVRGVPWEKGRSARASFDLACAAFPRIVERQRFPLSLQNAD